MGRLRTSEEIERRIRLVWGQEPKQSARAVHNWMVARYGDRAPKLRKTQYIIAEAKREIAEARRPAPEDPLINPWDDGWPEDAEDSAYLLTLWGFGGGRLTRRQVKWACRLRRALMPCTNIDDILRNRAIITLYINRERVREYLGEAEPYTADLDWLVWAKPWISDESSEKYKKMVKESLIPEMDVVVVVESAIASGMGPGSSPEPREYPLGDGMKGPWIAKYLQLIEGQAPSFVYAALARSHPDQTPGPGSQSREMESTS